MLGINQMNKNDYDGLVKLITDNLPENYGRFSFGKAFGKDLMLFGPTQKRSKRVLVVGGFHGNEVAGSWGIAEYIKENREYLATSTIGVYFIPVCNLGGFMNDTRYNPKKQISNEFCDKDGGYTVKLSDESQLLMNKMKQLQMISKDGVISCHENEGLDKYFYVYMYGSDKNISDALLEAGSVHYSKREDGTYSDVGLVKDITTTSEPYTIRNGIIESDEDGSFEFCLQKHGSRIGITVETPWQAKLWDRIECQRDFIDAFVSCFEEN